MRILVGMGLLVTGGALVAGAGVTGFLVGVGLMHMIHEREEEMAAEKPEPPAETTLVTIEAEWADMGIGPSARWPANGTNLSPERKREINNSTPDNPAIITLTDIREMDTYHVKVNLGSGRFKLAENAEPRGPERR